MMRALIGIQTEVGKASQVMEKLIKFPEILWARLAYGEWDIFAYTKETAGATCSDLLVNRIHKINGVKLTRTFVLAEMPKKTV